MGDTRGLQPVDHRGAAIERTGLARLRRNAAAILGIAGP